MRSILFVAGCAVALTLGACSQEHADKVKDGAKAAAADVKDAAHTIANDPDVKEAGTAIKEASRETAAELKAAAGDAKDKAQELGAKAGAETREAGRELKQDVKEGAQDTKKQVHEATR